MIIKRKTPNFWFTSDTHFSHENIVKGVSRWEDKSVCRDFDTLEEHDIAIVDGINACAKANDILYHAGDWSMGGASKVYEFRKQLICKNIHLAPGNHDLHIRNNKIIVTDDGFINIQHLFKTVDKIIEKKVNGQEMTVSHRSMRAWQKRYKGAWMLYGDAHDRLPPLIGCKNMDVGMDVAFRILGQYRPFNFDEIKEILDKQ